MEVILSPKYQVVIPGELRKQLELKSGQRAWIIARGGNTLPDSCQPPQCVEGAV